MILRLLGGVFDRLFALMGAFVFMQFPLFMNQYTHELKGHVNELQYHISLMNTAAATTGKSLEVYMQKFQNSSDPDFAAQGQLMQILFNRWQDFSHSLHALENSVVYKKLFVFMHYANKELFYSTFTSFQAGVETSFEGISYAFIGFFLGIFIYRILKMIVKGSFLVGYHQLQKIKKRLEKSSH